VPSGPLVGVLLADVVVGQPLPRAPRAFTQPLVVPHRDAGELTESLGGLRCAGQIRGDDRVRAERGQQPCRTLCLRESRLVQRYVGVALVTVLSVPDRLAVPPQ